MFSTLSIISLEVTLEAEVPSVVNITVAQRARGLLRGLKAYFVSLGTTVLQVGHVPARGTHSKMQFRQNA